MEHTYERYILYSRSCFINVLLCASLGPGKRIKCPAALIVSQDHKILKLPLIKSTVPQTYGPPSVIVENVRGK